MSLVGIFLLRGTPFATFGRCFDVRLFKHCRSKFLLCLQVYLALALSAAAFHRSPARRSSRSRTHFFAEALMEWPVKGLVPIPVLFQPAQATFSSPTSSFLPFNFRGFILPDR